MKVHVCYSMNPMDETIKDENIIIDIPDNTCLYDGFHKSTVIFIDEVKKSLIDKLQSDSDDLCIFKVYAI
jgi:hypothetical protein